MIVNLSELAFITSDSPVVLYNQLLEEMGLHSGATALAATELQIFYPIHPRLMICLYNPEVYKCESDERVVLEDLNDVHQLNALQYLQSDAQLFFDETISKHYVEAISEHHKTLRDRDTPMASVSICRPSTCRSSPN